VRNVLVSETQRFQCQHMETTLQVFQYIFLDVNIQRKNITATFHLNVRNVAALDFSLILPA
jgi:hypothetical protein